MGAHGIPGGSPWDPRVGLWGPMGPWTQASVDSLARGPIGQGPGPQGTQGLGDPGPQGTQGPWGPRSVRFDLNPPTCRRVRGVSLRVRRYHSLSLRFRFVYVVATRFRFAFSYVYVYALRFRVFSRRVIVGAKPPCCPPRGDPWGVPGGGSQGGVPGGGPGGGFETPSGVCCAFWADAETVEKSIFRASGNFQELLESSGSFWNRFGLSGTGFCT